MFMADRVALMRGGRLEQVGPPADLYNKPANRFVASFFGDVNRIPAVVRNGAVRTPLGAIPAGHYSDGTPVEVLVRPEALRLQPAEEGAAGVTAGRVLTVRLLGRSSMVHLSVPRLPETGDAHETGAERRTAASDMVSERGDERHGPDERHGEVHLHARIPGRFLPAEQSRLTVNLDPSQAFVFPREARP
jgi:iron(III) transport system ATP-binding protein